MLSSRLGTRPSASDRESPYAAPRSVRRFFGSPATLTVGLGRRRLERSIGRTGTDGAAQPRTGPARAHRTSNHDISLRLFRRAVALQREGYATSTRARETLARRPNRGRHAHGRRRANCGPPPGVGGVGVVVGWGGGWGGWGGGRLLDLSVQACAGVHRCQSHSSRPQTAGRDAPNRTMLDIGAAISAAASTFLALSRPANAQTSRPMPYARPGARPLYRARVVRLSPR